MNSQSSLNNCPPRLLPSLSLDNNEEVPKLSNEIHSRRTLQKPVTSILSAPFGPPSSFNSNSTTYSSPVDMTGSFLPCFDPEKHDFDMWNGTFQNFLSANNLHNLASDDVPNQNRSVSIFLSSLGVATYTLLCTLLTPDDPSTKTLDQLCTILHHHFKSIPKVLTERLQFHKRNQRQGESAQEFVSALCTLAVNCKFSGDLEERIRDQFIFGMSNECLQKNICQIHGNISLTKVVAMVTAHETNVVQKSAFVRVVPQQNSQISTPSAPSCVSTQQQQVQVEPVEPPCSNIPPDNYHRNLILRRRHHQHHQCKSSKKGSRSSKRSSSEHSSLFSS